MFKGLPSVYFIIQCRNASWYFPEQLLQRVFPENDDTSYDWPSQNYYK